MPNKRNIILELILHWNSLLCHSLSLSFSHSCRIPCPESIPLNLWRRKSKQACEQNVCLCLRVMLAPFFSLPKTSKFACVCVCVCVEVLCCEVRNSWTSINGVKTYDLLSERRWRGVIMCEFVLAGYLFLVASCAALLLLLCSLKFFSFRSVRVSRWVRVCCVPLGVFAAFASTVAPYTSLSPYIYLYLSVSVRVYLNCIYPIQPWCVCIYNP